ncbi:MAG: carbohydrate ABC transporter permease [Lacrimispora sp.]|uniref:carbohydrate ABC transporter permease n=1 Tax=Lacrimispora sp. TaxID=2719234 RepID=UPI0039E3BA2A
MMSRTKKKRNSMIFNYVVLVIMASFIVVPVLWMISTAFKTEPQTYYPQPKWIPDPFSLDSFHKFFNTYNFGRMTMNSLIVCLSAMVICVAFACLAGYGVTRFKFKGKKQLMSFLLITQMFPSVMLVVPFYAVLSRYKLVNTLFGLVIVYAATNIAFSTWMIVSYFRTIPLELDEAARVDGASSFRIFWNIILPLIVPGIAAVAMFVLFNGWNEYMYSSVLVSKDNLKTLTVGIISLNSQYQIKWNDLMAASSISSLPLVVLFVSFQKYFIAGMTGGAVKS